ncbi:Polycystin-2 [Fasciola gigantica]|uniref:Polycystin-2 n=1 Tax=Fasciola gigantica TaxID=46835 RepID=A0A504ZCH5_FASGI|nr:Polycystin-2 [Fasciola gigantica]
MCLCESNIIDKVTGLSKPLSGNKMAVLEANSDLDVITEIHYVDGDFDEDGRVGGTRSETRRNQFVDQKRQMSVGDSMARKFLRGLISKTRSEQPKSEIVFTLYPAIFLLVLTRSFPFLLPVTLLMVNSMTYFYFDSVYDLFVGKYTDPNDNSTMEFNGINDLETVWKYLKGQLINGLYWDTWYNRLNASFSETEFIGFDNKLLGVPRLRQLRVSASNCKVPEKMALMTRICYPDYSYQTHSEDRIIPKQNLTPVYTKDAWRFQKASETGATAYSAPINTYDGSGFVQDLSRDPKISMAILDELFQGLWIDEETRVLFVDFTIYNANINMFVIVKLIFEMSYTGGVFVGNEFQAAKLVRYVISVDYFVMACEILFILFVLYYIVEEFIEIKKNKWRYFLSAWNVLDIVVLTNCMFCIVLATYCTVTANNVIANLTNQMNSHPLFDVLSYWYGHFVRATAMCVFLAVLKVFKYVDFDRSLGQLTRTLSIALYDLIGFLVMFCIVYFAFAQLSYLAFGAATDGFQSFTQACYSLFRMMVGDINFPALRKAHYFLGPTFFVLYIFFAVFVLLNMFLAIINDAYAAVKEDLVKQRTQLKLGSMVKKRAKEALAKMRKKSRKSLIQVLQECRMFDREILPFDEYRRVLKKYGFGDAEITSTFVKYDRDGDNCLNVKEQRCMEDELEIGVRKSAKNLDEDEGHGTDEDGAEHEGEGKVEYVDPLDYKEMVERVDALEASLVTMLSHSDELLAMLEQVERAKREHRQRLFEMLNSEEFKSITGDGRI